MKPATRRDVKWWVDNKTSPSPFADLSNIILAVRWDMGDWGVRGWLKQWLVLMLYFRLTSIMRRMERLIARYQAGRLRTAPVVPVAAVDPDRKVEMRRERTPPTMCRLWPARFGWLVEKAGLRAVGYACQLRHLLGQPEMVALLTACPQAGRILRPLCHMLRVETSLLRPGVEVVPRDPRPAAVVRKRVRKPRPPIDWGRIPLPRGVLSAARRAGFKPVRQG